MLQPAQVELTQQVNRLLIVQMPMTAAHSVLKTGWVGARCQHFSIVIEFQNQTIAAGKVFNDVGRNMAHISEYSKALFCTMKVELARLTGIMGHRVGKDLKVAYVEPFGMTVDGM